jgi:hypothetical protein
MSSNTPKYFVPMNQGTTTQHEGEIGRIVGETETGYMVDFGAGAEEIAEARGYTANNKREAQILVRSAKGK